MAGTELVHLNSTVFKKQWQKDLAAVTKANNPDLVSMIMPSSMGKSQQERLREQAERL
jgi:hypothetical protein